MRTSTKLYILVFAIIFAVILPPILCYIFIVRPADHTAGQDTSPNTGNVSPDGIMEKDINLAIASKLASALTDQGFSVYLTRDSDKSLNSENASSKKTSDLKARTNLATNVNADLYISIHQNSYSAEYVHGAQVFYYSTSSGGKALAECIQEHLISEADPSNTRAAKGNSEYLVLRESPSLSAAF